MDAQSRAGMGQFAKVHGRAMGINVQPAHEGSPWEKGAVETSFSSVGTLFAQYVAFSATSLTGLVVGAATAGLTGAAWGLTTGAAVGLAVFVALYAFALARLRAADTAPEAVESSRNASPASR